MSPDFLIDLVGDKETAQTITLALSIILLVVIPLTVRWLVRLGLNLLKPVFVRVAGEELGTEINEALDLPIEFIVVILSLWGGLSLAIDSDAENLHQTIDEAAKILIVIGIFWAIFHLVDAVAIYARRFADDKRTLLNHSVIRFANQIGEALVVIIGFVVVMERLGYDLNGVLAGLGLTGLAVALAAQDTLANLLGYFVILSDVPFRIGDLVEVNDQTGAVEHIGFRTTHVRQLDQSLLIIPNKTFNDAVVKNWSRLSKRRFSIKMRLVPHTSTDQIRMVTSAIRQILETHDAVIHDGSEFVQFVDFGEDGTLNLTIEGYMNITHWETFQAAKQDLQLQILDILRNTDVQRAAPKTVTIAAPSPEKPTSGETN